MTIKFKVSQLCELSIRTDKEKIQQAYKPGSVPLRASVIYLDFMSP